MIHHQPARPLGNARYLALDQHGDDRSHDARDDHVRLKAVDVVHAVDLGVERKHRVEGNDKKPDAPPAGGFLRRSQDKQKRADDETVGERHDDIAAPVAPLAGP